MGDFYNIEWTIPLYHSGLIQHSSPCSHVRLVQFQKIQLQKCKNLWVFLPPRIPALVLVLNILQEFMSQEHVCHALGGVHQLIHRHHFVAWKDDWTHLRSDLVIWNTRLLPTWSFLESWNKKSSARRWGTVMRSGASAFDSLLDGYCLWSWGQVRSLKLSVFFTNSGVFISLIFLFGTGQWDRSLSTPEYRGLLIHQANKAMELHVK